MVQAVCLEKLLAAWSCFSLELPGLWRWDEPAGAVSKTALCGKSDCLRFWALVPWLGPSSLLCKQSRQLLVLFARGHNGWHSIHHVQEASPEGCHLQGLLRPQSTKSCPARRGSSTVQQGQPCSPCCCASHLRAAQHPVFLPQPGKDSCLLPLLVFLRVIFIPLFMLCNVQPRDYLPVIFSHDAWYIIFMIFFSISNGYLASLCMCFGPK